LITGLRPQPPANEAGTYLDAEAAYDGWRKGFAGPNIIAFGESLGGAVATELALRKPWGAGSGKQLFPRWIWEPNCFLVAGALDVTIKYETCAAACSKIAAVDPAAAID
jgi:pimeloyl-ACP methyl ester carboxylesterase